MRSYCRDLAFHLDMGRLLLLGAALLLLGGPGRAHPTPTPTAFNGAYSSHSLRYFFTGLSEPSQGLPQFITVGYVDDQLFIQYDSDTGITQPRVPWMEKVGERDPQYWDRQTQRARDTEQTFRVDHVNLQKYYNQTGGFHSLQRVYGCELRGDGSKEGYLQFGYDGRHYLALDKETLTWMAADTQAQISKRKWEAEPAIAQYWKAYLEEECIEWLQRYLDYGKETLLRAEPPLVKVMSQVEYEGTETLVCEAHGFYPKEIEATWRRDGEILEHATFRRDVAPNSDGTYHTWLSVDIDPEERDLYWCHVEHAGLPESLVLAREEPVAIVGLIVGVILAVLLLVGFTLGIGIIIKKWRMRIAYPEKKNQNCHSSSHPSSFESDSSEKELLH